MPEYTATQARNVVRCPHCQHSLSSLEGKTISRADKGFHVYLQSGPKDALGDQPGTVAYAVEVQFRWVLHSSKSEARPVVVRIRSDNEQETNEKLERAADLIAGKLSHGQEPPSSFEL